jgi:hypothetical protein
VRLHPLSSDAAEVAAREWPRENPIPATIHSSRRRRQEIMMRNTIKTVLLATALATGGAGLAMAQAVPIDATDEAPDTVYNPNAGLVYGQPEQPAIGRSGRSSFGYPSGYRGNAMLGTYGSPYAASSPWLFQQGRDQSDLGEY